MKYKVRKKRRLTANSKLAEQVANRVLLKRRFRALGSVFHPNWSPVLDHRIMKLKEDGDNFSVIADKIKRPRISVEQRFHRLRLVPDIIEKLEAFGLTDALYQMEGI